MASKFVTTSPTNWVLATSASEFLLQNLSSSPLYVVFALALPTGKVSDEPAHELPPNVGLDRGGLSGNVYVLSREPSARIVVSES